MLHLYEEKKWILSKGTMLMFYFNLENFSQTVSGSYYNNNIKLCTLGTLFLVACAKRIALITHITYQLMYYFTFFRLELYDQNFTFETK